MRQHPRPVVFVSSCIEFDHCRYDGGIIHSEPVKRLLDHVDVIRACPEMAIGLGSPREAIRLVQTKDQGIRLLSSLKGEDHSETMNTYVDQYLDLLSKKTVDGFILKAKSPTCGLGDVKVYSDIGKAPVLGSKSEGFFGGRIAKAYPKDPQETEKRLSNYKIRDRFFTAIFTLADFRVVQATAKIKHLVDFHARHKYLFMTYNQNKMHELGRMVANHEHRPIEEIFENYQEGLKDLLSREPSQKNRINVLTHIYGYFKKAVSPEEKEYYFDVLDQYLNNQTIYMNVLTILLGWAVRFKRNYLLDQTIFEPYPKELITLIDSGKDI